ncbi:toll/interleukin-1 receptor domain-containing protein [Niabella hibiscisoli]|uniref:toll/interleukin-1 receptor domain-containing protein n=1 Tax=Niabella hibiscisoli TaxID=1825928 RepID=UPI001F0DE37E|nr:toll/interleukin-1 receptor domain-containing protein [Niabella hibiscisoli]MCH5717837.1 toll/interleukin-1 receptor domain-containing protein [Niabella hibiscisoli]ULT38749.1 toll/interleukin-1 receptor domain-containing protein [Niabella sp. I65]
MDKKRGFISYSWSDADHQDWVTNLANRLVQDGVDIKYDKWDLKEGHDKYAFMESMVNSSDIDKVLIILDKNYCIKADNRKGVLEPRRSSLPPAL